MRPGSRGRWLAPPSCPPRGGASPQGRSPRIRASLRYLAPRVPRPLPPRRTSSILLPTRPDTPTRPPRPRSARGSRAGSAVPASPNDSAAAPQPRRRPRLLPHHQRPGRCRRRSPVPRPMRPSVSSPARHPQTRHRNDRSRRHRAGTCLPALPPAHPRTPPSRTARSAGTSRLPPGRSPLAPDGWPPVRAVCWSAPDPRRPRRKPPCSVPTAAVTTMTTGPGSTRHPG